MWINNTEGKKDAVFTMVCIAFAILCLNLVAGSLGTITVWSVAITPNFIDSGTITAFWGPLLAAYVARRGTAKYFQHKETDNTEEDV